MSTVYDLVHMQRYARQVYRPLIDDAAHEGMCLGIVYRTAHKLSDKVTEYIIREAIEVVRP